MLYLPNEHMPIVKSVGQALLNCHIFPHRRPTWVPEEEMQDGGYNLTFYENDGKERRKEWVSTAELTRRLKKAATIKVAERSWAVRVAEEEFAAEAGGSRATIELAEAALARRDANLELDRALKDYEAIVKIRDAVEEHERETT